MDRNGEDPLKSSSSPPDDVGTLRWCDESSTPNEPNQVSDNITSNPATPNSSRQTPNPDFIEYGSFSMDVNAFERELDQKRELKRHEQTPNYAIQLKSTPKRRNDDFSPSPTDHIIVSIRHSTQQQQQPQPRPRQQPNPNVSIDESDHMPTTHRANTRVISYEKVFQQKSFREITIARTVSSHSSDLHRSQTPVLHQHAYTTRQSSSSHEHLDDSAYHSHRVRVAGDASTTPTTISMMSSNNSLLQELDGDVDGGAVGGAIDGHGDSRFRSCSSSSAGGVELAHFQRAASEPPAHYPSRSMDAIATNDNRIDVSMNVVYAGNRSASSQSATNHQWNLVSGVADGNQPSTGRRHFARELFHSSTVDSDCSSPGWYNEYQSQSFHTDHQPRRMDFKRSNSQYDNHIREIRGTHNSLDKITHIFFRLKGGFCRREGWEKRGRPN